MARNVSRDVLSRPCVAGRKLRAIGISAVLLIPLATVSSMSAQDVSFEPRKNYFSPSPWAVATGDFNGDGVPDLAVANASADNVSVFLGNGDGTFRGTTRFPAGNSPWSVAVGDFNDDGLPDLAVVNHMYFGNVSVLLGNGDGTFQAPQTFAVGSEPTSVAVGKFRGVGMPDDLAVANSNSGSVSVLLGNGDGTFLAPQDFGADGFPRSMAVGDFNGDGNLDLAVANDGSYDVSVLLGIGDGTFLAAVNYDVGPDSSFPSVAVGDFNGDAVKDLAVASGFYGKVSVLLGNGDGTFQAAQYFAAGVQPWSVVVGDFNGDGLQDVAVANFGYRGEGPCVDSSVSVLLGIGDGSFQAPVNFDAGGGPRSVATADFNGDGLPDLAVAHSIPSGLSVLINNTTRQWASVVAPATREAKVVRRQLISVAGSRGSRPTGNSLIRGSNHSTPVTGTMVAGK